MTLTFDKKYLLKTLCVVFFSVLFFFANAQGLTREKISLDQNWQFSLADTTQQTSWENVTLPHTWNTKDVIDEVPGYYRGVGWYKRKLQTPTDIKDKSLFIYFEGANNITELYINNKFVARHNGGYTAFDYEISQYLNQKGSNEILIKVDNTPNLNALPVSADFTFYGGIYRNVWLVKTDKVHFNMLDYASDGVAVETDDVSGSSAMVRVHGVIKNDGVIKKQLKEVVEIKNADGVVIKSGVKYTNVDPGKEEFFAVEDLQVNRPHLWSTDDPYLYTVVIKITDEQDKSKVLDQITERLGLRWFTIDKEKGFFLNSKHIKLMGTNRHQDYEGIGNALTDDMHEQDIKLIKQMGANFIRVAHYPQAQRLLDACDKYGLLVWEEVPIVNEINPTDEFAFNARLALTEMLRQNYNHPSIVIWGFMNEVFATQKMRTLIERKELLTKTTELAKVLNGIAKREGGNRLTAMALEYTYADEYLSTGIGNVCDITGWNLYLGWYQKTMEDFGPFIDKWHQNFPDKPVIISEYGAGSDVRIHSLSPEKFDYSIEYQEKTLESYYKQIMQRDFIAGATVWNSFDFNSQGRMEVIPNINNKGLMTTSRTYKDPYFFMQAQLSKTPVLKIASVNWITRAGRAVNAADNYCIQPVVVYSNLKKVELFLDGRSLGKKLVVDKKAVWDVPFVNGKNTLYATADKLNDKLEINFRLQPYYLNDPKFTDIGVHFGTKDYYIDSHAGYIWEPEQRYIKGSWGYISDSTYAVKPPQRFDVVDTKDDLLYYQMRKNMGKVQFDVADGQYEVELLLVDKLPGNEFEIYLNGNKLYQYPELNISKAASSKKYIIQATDKQGISITFNKIEGDTFLSAVRIRKMN